VIAGLAAAKADIATIETDIRMRALAALADEGLLPVRERMAEPTP
jgi:hypothetical protein